MVLVKCPNCGKEVSDQAAVCPHCNTEFSVTKKRTVNVLYGNQSTPVTTRKESQNESSSIDVAKTWNTIGFIVGILAVVIGLAIVFSASGTLPTARFGADYYNYIYRALVGLETAIYGVTKAVGGMMTLLGGYIVCKYGPKIAMADHSNNKAKSVQKSTSALSEFDDLPDL